MSDKPTGTFRTDTGDELEYVDFDGHPRVLACLPPRPNFGAMPSFADHVPLVPRQEWKPISRRNWFTFILDQNGFSSCVGNGGAGGLRRARLLSGMTDVELSAAFLYSLINGGRDAGAIISDALTALLQSGTCLASQCPESQIYGPPRNSSARTEAIQTAKRFRILKAYHANSFDEAMSGLQLDYIWVGGIYVAGDFAHLDSNGIAPAHPNRYGNHCVHGDGCYQSGGRWILDGVNSWGLRFGQDGRMGLVDEHFQEPGGSDSFLIQAAIEDPMDPNPPPPAKG
jgi:hypothetical protein